MTARKRSNRLLSVSASRYGLISIQFPSIGLERGAESNAGEDSDNSVCVLFFLVPSVRLYSLYLPLNRSVLLAPSAY